MTSGRGETESVLDGPQRELEGQRQGFNFPSHILKREGSGQLVPFEGRYIEESIEENRCKGLREIKTNSGSRTRETESGFKIKGKESSIGA